MSSKVNGLEQAWNWRNQSGIFQETQAVRVFHGPGEGSGKWETVAVDRFGDHYWVTLWEDSIPDTIQKEIVRFYSTQGARSIMTVTRQGQGQGPLPTVWFGKPPEEKFEVLEKGRKYAIQMHGVKHPGLFLDHLPLRDWLETRMKGLRVLNTFAYTGSLSVAAARSGASEVWTLDLSGATTTWAKENLALNGFEGERYRVISGDVFEWLPRLKRQNEKFDCVILDPPSFSHGKKGRFSTAQDLAKLHALALDVLNPGGWIVTSINSAQVSRAKFLGDVRNAAQKAGANLCIHSEIGLPETFPTRLLGDAETERRRYLKGWIFRADNL